MLNMDRPAYPPAERPAFHTTMITPDSPAADSAETNTLTIFASQAAIGESVPAVGDAVDLSRVAGTVTAVRGDKITLRVDTVDGEAVPAAPSAEADTSDADLMREAEAADAGAVDAY